MNVVLAYHDDSVWIFTYRRCVCWKVFNYKKYEDVSEWDIILWPIDIIVTIACLIIFSLVEICSTIKKHIIIRKKRR